MEARNQFLWGMGLHGVDARLSTENFGFNPIQAGSLPVYPASLSESKPKSRHKVIWFVIEVDTEC